METKDNQNKNTFSKTIRSARDIVIDDICKASGLDRTAYDELRFCQLCEIYEKVVDPVIKHRNWIMEQIVLIHNNELDYDKTTKFLKFLKKNKGNPNISSCLNEAKVRFPERFK